MIKAWPWGVLLWCLAAGAARAAEPFANEAVIPAPVAEVWRVFTTAEGYRQLGVAQVEIDLRPGGEIRSHYDPAGTLGDEQTIVNEILAFDPERMLSLRTKKPPANFPFMNAYPGTWSVFYFEPVGDNRTRVRIVGLGYRDDAESRQMREVFQQANQWTLEQLARQYDGASAQ